MALFSKKKEHDNFERIIISRTDKIGDMVLSIPSFFIVRKMYPNAKIMVITSKYNGDLVKNSGLADEFLPIDHQNLTPAFEAVRQFRADVFIALYSDSTVLKLAAVSGAKTLIGPISKPMSWFVYNRGVIQRRSKSLKNEGEYNLDLVRELSPTLFDVNFQIGGKIVYDGLHAQSAQTFLDSIGINDKKFIIMHIFSGGSAKNFTPDEYIQVAQLISQKLPKIKIIFTGTAQDREILDNLLKKMPENACIYTGGEDILTLVALIDKCALFIGGSTGPTHIAGNLRKKVVAIFPSKPSQSPKRWGLLGNDELTSYIIPDEGNIGENYKVKTFDKVTTPIIEKTADTAIKLLD